MLHTNLWWCKAWYVVNIYASASCSRQENMCVNMSVVASQQGYQSLNWKCSLKIPNIWYFSHSTDENMLQLFDSSKCREWQKGATNGIASS